MVKKVNNLKLKRLSIKGKVLVLNTLVLSKIWYTAAVLLLTNASLKKLYNDLPNYLKQFELICTQYIWANSRVSGNIDVKDLELSLNKRRLSLAGIGNKALAMRSKQLA